MRILNIYRLATAVALGRGSPALPFVAQKYKNLLAPMVIIFLVMNNQDPVGALLALLAMCITIEIVVGVFNVKSQRYTLLVGFLATLTLGYGLGAIMMLVGAPEAVASAAGGLLLLAGWLRFAAAAMNRPSMLSPAPFFTAFATAAGMKIIEPVLNYSGLLALMS